MVKRMLFIVTWAVLMTGMVAGVRAVETTAESVGNPDIAKIETFMTNVIALLTGMAGVTASGFLVWGGYGYITSSGSPDELDRAKRTVYYSIVGLAISGGSYVLSNAVVQMAQNAFGK